MSAPPAATNGGDDGLFLSLKHQLESPDSIMEPNILSILTKFLRSGGNPTQGVQLLSSSYRGMADMCNVVSDWIETVDPENGRATAQATVDAYLRQLILNRFDSAKADRIFAEGSAAPEWLAAMVANPTHRQLIYDLAEKHEDNMLLNFAIKRISEEGHQGELAGVPSATKFVAVYSRMLVSSIIQLHSEDEVSLSDRLNKLVKICCQEPFTYMYAQALLTVLLATDSANSWMRRIHDELSANVHEHGRIAQHIDSLLSGLSAYPRLSDALYSILRSGQTTTGDLLILQAEFVDAPKPPPIALLRHFELFDMLLADIFLPSRRAVNPPAPQVFSVLAFAASVNENSDGTVRHAEVQQNG